MLRSVRTSRVEQTSNFNWEVSTCSIVYFSAVIRSDLLVLLPVHHCGRLKHCKIFER